MHWTAMGPPPVRAETDRQFQLIRKKNHDPVVLVESAVLFEAGQTRRFDKMVVVWCTPEQQMERCLKNFKLPVAAVEQRMANQIPPDEKKKRADFVIDTSSSIEETNSMAKEVCAQR